jgi:DNA-binding transcriptional MerR regulator
MMTMTRGQCILRTIDIARAAGIAVNTVRAYQQLGYLPPVPRAPNGYRQFDERHLLHVRLIRQGMQCTWLGGQVRQMVLDSLIQAAEGDLDRAEANVQRILNQLRQDKDRAEAAVVVLERWAAGEPLTSSPPSLQIGAVADYLDVSVDVLRNWERNGLLTVPRAANGYRRYGATEIERLVVIYTLRQARYSTLSILRMFRRLEHESTQDLRAALDTPHPEDDIVYATDHWLSTLDEIIAAAEGMQDLLQTLQTLH